jgi:hypothetical protein
MIDRNQTDRLLIAALILTMFAFCFASCCPKIIESSTTRIDTLYVYRTDTVTIHDTTVYKTDFNVDSLLAILNAPIPTNKVLSSNTNRGVTTKLIVRDGKLVCEAQIDSLQHVIDSVRSSVVNVTNNVIKKVEVKKPDSWFEKLQKWFFWVVIALCLGYIIAKTQTYWIKYLPIK